MKRFFSWTLLSLMLVMLLLAGCKGDPNTRKKKFVDLGNKFFDKGDYKAAALNYRKATQEDKQYADAYYKLGLTYLKTGSIPDAVNNLQKAFTLAPDNVDAGAQLANIYVIAVAADPKKARLYLTEIKDVSDRLLQRNPKSFDGLRLSAYLLIQDGKIDEALAVYKKANEAKPNDSQVIMPWAITLFQQHKDKEGEQLVLNFLQHRKDFAPAYDLLYTLYARDHRSEDAEKMLRAKADAMPDHLDYRIQLAGHYFASQRRTEMEKELATVAGSGKDGMGHLHVGDFFFALKEYDRSQKEFEAGMQNAGKNKALFQKRIVNLYNVQGKYAESAALIETVVKENPKDNEAIGIRAMLQVNSGDLGKIDAAISDLQAMVRRDPSNYIMHHELARAYLARAQKTNKTDQVDLARVELESSIKLRPDYPLSKLILAELQINKGEFGKAVVLAEEVLSANPANMQAQMVRATAWARQGEFVKSRTALEGVLKASPTQQDARYLLGEVYRMEGNYKAAEATYREFRTMSPGDPRAWAGIAQTLQESRRLKDAEAFLKEEIAADPKKEQARAKLAEIYTIDKQYDAAIEQYNILLKDHPKQSDLYSAMADTMRKKGDMQNSIATFRKAVELNPNAPAPMTALAMVLEEYQPGPEARVLYEKILKIEPENVIALNNLAFLKAEEGTDIDGALTMAQKAKQKAPQIDVISDTLGWIYIKKNLSDDAIRIFNELCRKEPDRAMFRYHLAQALIQKGDKQGAKRELQSALTRISAPVPDQHEQQLYEKKIRDLITKLA